MHTVSALHTPVTCSTQELYAAERNMRARCRFGQAMLLRELGRRITPGSTDISDRFDYDATRWHASLLGVYASGNDLPEALDAWMRAAQTRLRSDSSRRATDGRPDCPFNGSAPLPPVLT